MDTARKKCVEDCENEKGRSPSPKPFQEPDGMVTIELNRQSPSPPLILGPLKENKEHGFKYMSCLVFISLLCLVSFAAAISIHWDEIGWISEKLTGVGTNHSLIPTPSPLEVSQTTVSFDMGTCPVDPQEEYRIHLLMCEKTKTFKDCCHLHLRSQIPQINDVCSILEMLDLLVEYKQIFTRRKERDINIDNDYEQEKEKRKQEKMKTKEKILSYIKHLNKPLQREIPALFDWFGDLFVEYQEEFGIDDVKDKEHIKKQESHHLENTDEKVPNYDSPSEQSIILEQKLLQSDESGKDNQNEENISDSEKHKATIQSEMESNTEDVPTGSLQKEYKMENVSGMQEDIDAKNTITIKYATDNTEEVDSTLFPNIQESYPIITKQTPLSKEEIIITSETEIPTTTHTIFKEDNKVGSVKITDENAYTRTKRDEISEPYAIENNWYPPPSDYENRPYPDPNYDNNFNMQSNQENIPAMYAMENDRGQGFNTPLEKYSVLGSPPPEMRDDTEEYKGYHSPIADKSREEELRLPIYTDERDFARQSWKDLQIYGFTPEEYPPSTISPDLYYGGATYSYLDPISSMPRTTTESQQKRITSPYSNNNRQFRTEEAAVFNRENLGTRINDKKLELSTVISTTIRALTTTESIVDAFDATDSIESIENIQGNNESIVFEIGKTKISISKSENKPVSSTERIYDNVSNTVEDITTESPGKDVTNYNKSESSESPDDSERAAQQGKGSAFQLVNEDTQSSQNVLVNPNMCQYPPPLGSPNRFIMGADNHPQIINMIPSNSVQKPPVYVINPSVYSYVPPSPMIPHYGPITQQYNPYAYINPLSTAQMSPVASGQVQVANGNGQMYICNPAMPAANIPNIQPSNPQALEIRSSNNLQESFDRIPQEIRTSNKTRSSLNCPLNEESCMDGSKCISVRHVCDNEVHCDDGSDETFCSCKERIAEIRLCDGYFDCPDGEDEAGCFGCLEDEINCDDWSRFRKGTCIPMDQRCDGIRQCEITGKDEEDCSILIDHLGERNPMKISNAAGFLHRNFKGKWYPTCFGSEVWALDVCKIEAGPSTSAPLSRLEPNIEKYEGDYINLLPNREVSFAATCVKGRAAFVECPPLFCGLRMTIKNPYRSQEVDTTIEDMMNHLNRQDYTLGDDLEMSRRRQQGEFRTRRSEDFILGGERVVGGRASQPAAWPWVVSIYKNGIFHCGGVIINELWILTAAHCVDKYWLFYYEIQAGILRRFSYSPMEQIRWVVATIAHEEYDKSNLKNDIALMRLSSPVRYNRYIRPICLPSETTAGKDYLRGPSPGTICTTVGWGATVEHGTDPDHMREVEVPILKNCKHQEDIEGQEICAGLFEGGKDACQGDSGGPFMCQNPNNPSQWYLAGIVSHGEGCARPNEPGVYTRVSQYIGWIADNMREENFMSRIPLQKCPGYICRGTNKCIPKKRHCDKIVDCLMGDDETNCGNTIHNIFKFSSASFMPFLRTSDELETKTPVDNNGKDSDEILGAVIINSDFENATLSPSVPDMKREENLTVSTVIYHYENKEYFTNNTKNADYFRCNKLLQMIPINKRCNKMLDCEDGTDEEECKCVDYLKITHPNAICDGVVDCKDSTDESFCFVCKTEEFTCRKSRMCISNNLWCDGKPDCSEGEDELDCVALTDGKSLLLDSTHRPNMSLAGVISINRSGKWRNFCKNSQSKPDATIATNVCNYLGFGEYTQYVQIKPVNHMLKIMKMGSDDQHTDNTTNNSPTCEGVYVWCSGVYLENALDRIQDKHISLNLTFEATWNAAIFSDGVYKCMGVILNTKWILTSLNCFDGILHYSLKYLTVVLGKGARYLDIPGPHDHIYNVAESYQVDQTDIAVLRLEKNITFNRYIQPTDLKQRIDTMRKERCVAVGLKDGKPSFVFLETKSACIENKNCFSAASNGSCFDGSWSGVITCYAGNGWYPASVFSSEGNLCPFKEDANFSSVRFLAKKIEKYSDNLKPVIQNSFCNGFRCDLGNCIDADMLCDGLPQCLYGEDETEFYCIQRRNACPILKNCVCPADHLQCLNGKCVHKSKFCDRVDDCGDYSDEPPRCTCRSFMKLTHPERVCDGHVNCIDSSDEDPEMCQCQFDDFVCPISKLCISNEMVCNGFEDCPDGEDEKECYAFAFNITSPAHSGEVLTKTAGHLFQSCFLDSPPKSELDNICQHLGFNSSSTHHLEPYSDKENTILVPVTDTFNAVWIRREGKVPLLFRTRTGNDAYLSFRKQNNCHRLHIECT